MPEELMKSFLEELIESLEGTADAMRILLQYYHVSSEEEKCQNHIDIGSRNPEPADQDSAVG